MDKVTVVLVPSSGGWAWRQWSGENGKLIYADKDIYDTEEACRAAASKALKVDFEFQLTQGQKDRKARLDAQADRDEAWKERDAQTKQYRNYIAYQKRPYRPPFGPW